MVHTVNTFAVQRFGRFAGLCLLAMFLLLLVHISVGTVSVPLDAVVATLVGQPQEALHHTVINNMRLPRALIAITAGAMLGLSGAILQTIVRNPLASPSLTGVLSGAVLGIVLFIHLYNPQTPTNYPIAGIVGGLAAGALTYGLSWQGGTDPVRLALAGVLVAAMLNAFTSLVLLIDQYNTSNILHWMIGSLNGRVWTHVYAIMPIAAVMLPLGFFTASIANALNLGDAVAVGIGVRLEFARGGLLFVAVVLAAAAVSVVGNIAFVGLIAPHSARQIVGGDARRLFPFSAIVAAGLMLIADIIARTLTFELGTSSEIGINNLPVGAVTALLGALFFMYLLIRRK
jgi:iron complex transport system permease protein